VLGASVAELLPEEETPRTLEVLRGQARRLFAALMERGTARRCWR
jgi:hypothetical protein